MQKQGSRVGAQSISQPPASLSSCPQAYLWLHRMGPQVPSAPPALWVLGCLALFLWLWTLCTACDRYVHPWPGFGVGQGSRRVWLCMSLPTGPWARGWHLSPPSLPPWPDESLAPRKRAQRPQARPQRCVMPVEAVSARLSPGPGWGQHRTHQPSLFPVTAETPPPLLPQQVRHQAA